jgi:hypothetical protein
VISRCWGISSAVESRFLEKPSDSSNIELHLISKIISY